MMKYIFSALVLFPLCFSTDIDINLNLEIIERLEELHKLRIVNITSPESLREPSDRCVHVSCLGTFAKELKNVLNHVSLPQEKEHICTNLKLNLKALGHHQQTDHKCLFKRITNTSMVFKRYSTFLRKLNNLSKVKTSG